MELRREKAMNGVREVREVRVKNGKVVEEEEEEKGRGKKSSPQERFPITLTLSIRKLELVQ